MPDTYTVWLMLGIATGMLFGVLIGVTAATYKYEGVSRTTRVFLILTAIVWALCIWGVHESKAGITDSQWDTLQSCREVSTDTNGTVICAHRPMREEILVTYMSPKIFDRFWNSGKAGELYIPLCLDGVITAATEVVYDGKKSRTRTISCGDDEESPWSPSNLRLQLGEPSAFRR